MFQIPLDLLSLRSLFEFSVIFFGLCFVLGVVLTCLKINLSKKIIRLSVFLTSLFISVPIFAISATSEIHELEYKQLLEKTQMIESDKAAPLLKPVLQDGKITTHEYNLVNDKIDEIIKEEKLHQKQKNAKQVLVQTYG